MHRFVALGVLGIFICIPESIHANLFENGDFETGDFSGWQSSGNVTVSTESGYQNAGGTGVFPTGDFVAAFSGGDDPNDGVLSQEIVTLSGQQYRLAFDYGAFSVFSGSQSLSVSVQNAIDMQVLVDETIEDSSPTNDLGTLFDAFVFEFEALGELTQVTFSDASTVTVNIDGTLDNVDITPVCPVDFTGDGVCDITDVDLMQSLGPLAPGIPATGNEDFDLNGDGVVDLMDRDEWLSVAASTNCFGSPYKLGDANLDGVVDGIDFITWNGAKFTDSLLWSDGNFNGDSVVDGQDFIAWNQNKFTSSDGVTAVPEPAAWFSLLCGSLGLATKKHRRVNRS